MHFNCGKHFPVSRVKSYKNDKISPTRDWKGRWPLWHQFSNTASGECPRILISQSHSRGSPLWLEWPTHGPASKCQVPCWWKPLQLPVQRKLTCLLSRSTFSKDVQEKYLSLKGFNLRQQLKLIFYTFTALELLCEHNYLSSPKRWPVQFYTLTITHYFYDCFLPATNAAVLMSLSSHVRSLLTSYLLLFLEWKRQKHLPAWLYYILYINIIRLLILFM